LSTEVTIGAIGTVLADNSEGGVSRMLYKSGSFLLLATLSFLTLPSTGSEATRSEATEARPEKGAVLWRDPSDIAARNLYYGRGGEADQPEGPYTFIEEDLNGTNPKYVVRDGNKVKWTVKLGMEAQPETVASRLVWAAGYFANEDYFLPELRVDNMPAHLKRGRKLVGRNGEMHNARLKRHMGDEKSEQNWQWRHDPFVGTRELSGLKVIMALINNWDLKDTNNKIYAVKDSDDREYVVSDLGASFGTTGLSFPFSHSKGDLKSYSHSRFIQKITPEYVDFRTPTRPALIYATTPRAFFQRLKLDNLLHHVPRDDVRWIAHILAELGPEQIHDAFRAADYTPEQTDAFSKIVEQRITELNNL
jgi:hypothetical protein